VAPISTPPRYDRAVIRSSDVRIRSGPYKYGELVFLFYLCLLFLDLFSLTFSSQEFDAIDRFRVDFPHPFPPVLFWVGENNLVRSLLGVNRCGRHVVSFVDLFLNSGPFPPTD